ncbi:MAG: hypothetical protein WC408_06140 [Candidatus Micrarchaeia archaeon]
MQANHPKNNFGVNALHWETLAFYRIYIDNSATVYNSTQARTVLVS